MNIQVLQADITTIEADAIVNAANTSLLGGGGVDGAIHRKGGKSILEECIQIRNRQGGCETGKAVITTGGNLPARYVIHTVGPVWNGGNKNETQLLRDCYINSLNLALEYKLKTIAFPNISTGIYLFPKDKAAAIAIDAVKNFNDNSFFDTILFVCFDKENYDFHLSQDRTTTEAVGGRRGSAIVLTIKSREMCRDGLLFYRSANGVWLTEKVPAKYINYLENNGSFYGFK